MFTDSELHTIVAALAKYVATLEKQRDTLLSIATQEKVAVFNRAINENHRLMKKCLKKLEDNKNG